MPLLDEEPAVPARLLRGNTSAAVRQGIADAVRAAMAESDREAYIQRRERPDTFWSEVEAWGER